MLIPGVTASEWQSRDLNSSSRLPKPGATDHHRCCPLKIPMVAVGAPQADRHPLPRETEAHTSRERGSSRSGFRVGVRTLEVVQGGLFWFWGVELMPVGRHRALESHGGGGLHPPLPFLLELQFLNLKLNLNLKLIRRGLKLALGGAVPKLGLKATDVLEFTGAGGLLSRMLDSSFGAVGI